MSEKIPSLKNPDTRKHLYGWIGGLLGVFSGVFWTFSALYSLYSSTSGAEYFLGKHAPDLMNKLSSSVNLSAGLMAFFSGIMIMAAWKTPKTPNISDSSNAIAETTTPSMQEAIDAAKKRCSTGITAHLPPQAQADNVAPILVLVAGISVLVAWRIFSSSKALDLSFDGPTKTQSRRRSSPHS